MAVIHIFQKAVEYLYQTFPFHGLPKFTKIGIFGLKMYHLATQQRICRGWLAAADFEEQGDQISLLKSRPKCSPTRFLSIYVYTYITNTMGKSCPQICSTSVISEKSYPNRPNRRKFSQSGHSVGEKLFAWLNLLLTRSRCFGSFRQTPTTAIIEQGCQIFLYSIYQNGGKYTRH
jgi:hypothetical protein